MSYQLSNRFFSGLKLFIFALLAPITLVISGQAVADESDLYKGMSARAIGPGTMSGRISAIDVVNSDPSHIYVASASGGVWHSTDSGTTWTPIFDDGPVASMGAIAINQSNPDIIWLGTGEGAVRNSVSIGNGMYKSMDAGKTWSYLGLPESEHINRIALHPNDPDIAWVAAMGRLWSDGGERGIYKTTDGGESWSLILKPRNDRTGGTDIKIDPNNPNNLFASTWQFRRYPDYFESGGVGSGLFVSHNGGGSWRELTEEDGLPAGPLGRSVFTIAPSNTRTIYALIEADDSAIIRSDDGGITWRMVNQDKGIANRPFYYMELKVDPSDPETVYNIATTLSRSNNGAQNFEGVNSVNCCSDPRGLHIDLHSMWINPANSDHMIMGNDGGIGISYDQGKTWRFVANLPLAQFYQINVDNAEPYNIYGGLQDNGTFRGPSEVWENGGIMNFHWQEIGFGDGFDAAADPENNLRGYGMSQGGSLYRWNLETGESTGIRPNADETGDELRFNWNSGFAQDPFDPATIYYGSQYLHISNDRGDSWRQLSGDLTTDNPDLRRTRMSGGITRDVTAAENWQTITAVTPSKLEQGLIWVGTDDGRVHITRDGGDTWTSIADKLRSDAKGSWVPHIEASPHDPSVAFIVFDDHRRGNMEPHAYRIDNYGKKWTRIVNDDVSGYALSIRQDHVDPNLLWLGTEFGLYLSQNGGKDWMKWTAGVPTVSVMDMAIQERENDLVLGTHGRGLFVIDDYSGLRNMSKADMKAPVKVLSVSGGLLYNRFQTPGTRFVAHTAFIAPNEDYGMMVTFVANGDDLAHPNADVEKSRQVAKRAADYAKNAPKATKMDVGGNDGIVEDNDGNKEASKANDKVKVDIINTDGDIVRTFTRKAHQGINRITWDGRINGSGVSLSDRPADADLPAGRLAMFGDYTVRLTYGGNVSEGTGTITPDLRVDYTMADYQARADFIDAANEKRDAATMMVKRLRALRADAAIIKSMAEKAAKTADGAAQESLKQLAKEASDVSAKIQKAEDTFVPKDRSDGIHYTADKVMARLGSAFYMVVGRAGAPSAAGISSWNHAEQHMQERMGEAKALINSSVADLRAKFDASGLSLLGG